MEVKMMTSNNELITKKDLRKIFWRSLPMEFSWHYERQMHMGFEFMMIPALKKYIKMIQKNIKKHYKEIWNSLTVLCMLQRLLVVL